MQNKMKYVFFIFIELSFKNDTYYYFKILKKMYRNS
jgi:hypothetical protein